MNRGGLRVCLMIFPALVQAETYSIITQGKNFSGFVAGLIQ